MASLNFNANDVEPLGSFDPLPIGEYTVVISASEMKDTKTGKGQYLQLVYDVVEGDYHGKKVFDRLNVVNENETAQNIAQRALSSICRAVGVMTPKDSEELHDKPFIIKVGIRAASGEFQASNVVKEYKSIFKDEPTKAEPKKSESAAPAKKTAKKMPWEK
jgi:hypothetical protein